MQLKLNKEYHLLAVRWDEQWEFDCPCVLLSPVLRVYEDGSYPETLFEDFIVDGMVALSDDGDGTIRDNDVEFDNTGKTWRGWNLKTLKRRAREALNGKDFPVKCYQAEECYGMFVKADNGEIEWKDVEMGMG